VELQISPFLDRKLLRRFRTLDTDGDGFVEREDFDVSVSRLGAAFGLAPGDARVQRLRTLSLGLWQHLSSVADVDSNGRISHAEYKQSFAQGLLETQDSFDAGYVPFLEAIMAIADTDGDGKLDADEHVRWTGSLMGLAAADAHEVHRRLDSDNDGHITAHDLLEAIREYYFDEHPDSAGSWLLGRLDD
jgi:Ca2+-binding EF-hand superfamily protein